MGIISGSVSFRGRFGDHFRVGDHFGLKIISGAVQAFNHFFLPDARNCGYARMKDLECAMDSQGVVVMRDWKIWDAQ